MQAALPAASAVCLSGAAIASSPSAQPLPLCAEHNMTIGDALKVRLRFRPARLRFWLSRPQLWLSLRVGV